jgi:hypothetical protein
VTVSRRIARLALTALLVPLDVAAAQRAPAGPELILSHPQVDLGSSTPEESADVPRFVLGVTIVSESPWTLQLIARDLVSREGKDPWPADHLLWRLRGDRFRRLSPGLPIALSAGPPTGAEPFTLFFEFAVQGDWSIRPASYEGTLSFLLTAAEAAPAGVAGSLHVDAPVRFRVLPLASLQILDPAPDSPAVDPSRPGWSAYPPVRVSVRANTDWTLSAEPIDDFRHQRAAASLPVGLLAIDEPAGGERTFQRAVPTVLSSGGPTGAAAREVTVRLRVRTVGGEPAGQYRLPVRFRLSPVPAPP